MALNRKDSSSMFDALKNTSLESNKKVKKEQPKTTPQKEKAVKLVDEKVDEPISTSIDSKNVALAESANPFIFKNKKEAKETKSVRKQFLFTPSYAKWIKDTALANDISENQVMENLIKMAMDN